MDDRFTDFNEKRMYIFSEVVKRYWNGNLNNTTDLDTLANDIKNKYDFKDTEVPFINDHIRVAMGLNPNGSELFSDEMTTVKSSQKISKPVVARIDGPCKYCNKDTCECSTLGKYENQMYSRANKAFIVNDKCLDCGYCVSKCDFGAIADKIEFLPVINLLKNREVPVYATVAPAIVGQFGDTITMGKLRTALKMIGFEDMIEVALFADILTIKEAFEFNDLVKKEEDFFLTSCCCPIWFNIIKNNYSEIYKHLSPSVSPMIASGRILKELYKNAKVVFIAPCIAKKSEMKEPELAGAIDYVLTFRELQEFFNALAFDLKEVQEHEKDQASFAGRVYARTGGVSFSVKTVVNRIEPSRVIKLKARKVSGVKECRKILDALNVGEKVNANFIEGMGCPGGCVGGPKTNLDADKATKMVNEYGEESFILTPLDNLNVMKILEQFGIHSIEELMENENMNKILSRKLVMK